MEFSKKRILVVGMGVSGLSTARMLIKEGAYVTINDNKRQEDINREYLKQALDMGATLETGGHREQTFTSSDLIIVSPGVPLDIQPLNAARKEEIEIIGEMELASRMIRIPIAAITGTNGKTTAVKLLGAMAESSGSKVFVGGNIGTPLIDFAAGNQDADYIVAEVSSFQLDSMELFCPEVSLLLNISPDHLDRYPDYGAYIQSKFSISRNQGPGHYAVLNDDDEKIAGYRPDGGVSILRYGMDRKDYRQAFMKGKSLIASLPGKEAIEYSTDRFSLPGRHNIENLMGTVLAGLALGLEPKSIQSAIDNFRGLPHRMEMVGSIGGVDFYDDSKATNVDAAVRAITSFDKQIILIGGGRHKGGDYSPLVEAAKGRVKRVILMGESRQLMERSFEDEIPFSVAETMKEAVFLAYSSSAPGDIILLAPACSSFDMFESYSHRGDVFQEEVEGLKHGS